MGYYLANNSLIGTSKLTNSHIFNLDTALLYSSSSNILISFFSDTVPNGISAFTSGILSYSHTWSASTGLTTVGEAGTSFVFTVQPTNSFTGNNLIQTSFFYGSSGDPCPDPGIAIWNATNSRTSPKWNWNPDASRIAVTNNCATSTQIYGKTTMQTGGTSWTYTINTWYTMHFYHEPTLNRCRYKMTVGFNDWDIAGTTVASEISLAESINEAYYIGIGSDSDILANPCQFSGIKVTKI